VPSKDTDIAQNASGKNIDLEIAIKQPGYIRVVARREAQSTKVEWAHDSAWRFMPTIL